MARVVKKIQILVLAILLVTHLPHAKASGQCCNKRSATSKSLQQCEYIEINKPEPHHYTKKHKTHKSKKHRHSKVESMTSDIEVTEEASNTEQFFSGTHPKIYKKCVYTPEGRVECKVLNPADIVDFTCDDFTKKLDTCEAYTCQAPYVLDPTVKTQWKIMDKNAERCVISNTTEDVGLKDKEGKPIPITQTCEYDELGIEGLKERFLDMQTRYFHYSNKQHSEGIHNCTFKSRGIPIRTLKLHP